MKRLKDVNKPRETDIRKDIQRYLDAKGIFNWRQWQGQFSVRGIPDISGILPGSGRAIGIEVKLPGWKPNPDNKHYQEQAKFIRNINLSNGIAFFATSVQDVDDKLRLYERADRLIDLVRKL